MSSAVEYEAMNAIAPVKNSEGMTCIAVLAVSPSSQVVDLLSHFGTGKHFITLQADTRPADGKFYIAFGVNDAGSISEVATGSGATVCFSIADNQELPVRLPTHHAIATGVATLTYPKFLYYKGATGGATGYLRIYRSSLEPGQTTREFKAPNVY
jgi:hypothetical protein